MNKITTLFTTLLFLVILIVLPLLFFFHSNDIQQYSDAIQQQYESNDAFHQDRKTHGFGTYSRGLSFNGDDRHYGVDYRLPKDTRVLAATDGQVTRTFQDEYGGNVLEIKEANQPYYQWYMHLNEFNVRAGDVVKAGDIVALSGNTGSQTTGPHLHFQRMKGAPAIVMLKILNRLLIHYLKNNAVFINSHKKRVLLFLGRTRFLTLIQLILL